MKILFIPIVGTLAFLASVLFIGQHQVLGLWDLANILMQYGILISLMVIADNLMIIKSKLLDKE